MLLAWLTAPALAAVIDATRTIPLASTESLAMGSAGLAFATGARSSLLQPAAVATRSTDSTGPFSLSASLSATSVGAGRPLDVSNLGAATSPAGVLGMAGLALMFRHWGMGFSASALDLSDDDTVLAVSETHLDGGGSVMDGHLTFGLGLRSLALTLGDRDVTYAWSGAGVEGGATVTSVANGFNFGAAARSVVRATSDTSGTEDVLTGAVMPWQLAAGAGWASRQSSVAERIPFPVRAAVEVVADGPVDDGVAVESLVLGEVYRRGEKVTFSPHAGVEGEVWPDRLRVRTGAWLEPARTQGSRDRLHGSLGTELRVARIHLLHDLVDFQLSWETGVDLAPRYQQVAWVSLGVWGGGLVGAPVSTPP